MRVMTEYKELVGKYVSEKVGIPVTNTPYVGFAVFDADGDFVAGVVVSNFRETDCEISMAAETPNWARKGVIKYILGYIFDTLVCVRCTCIVKSGKDSKRTQRFLRGLGFVLEGNLRRAYDGSNDALVFGLLSEECRFSAAYRGLENGQKVRTSGTDAARSVPDGGSADTDQS
jgi:hypothetical protein